MSFVKGIIKRVYVQNRSMDFSLSKGRTLEVPITPTGTPVPFPINVLVDSSWVSQSTSQFMFPDDYEFCKEFRE